MHLYESDKRIGGHVNTVLYPHPSHQNSSSQDADPVPVDTCVRSRRHPLSFGRSTPSDRNSLILLSGFIVFNPTTYASVLILSFVSLSYWPTRECQHRYPNFIRFCRDVAKVPFTETGAS